MDSAIQAQRSEAETTVNFHDPASLYLLNKVRTAVNAVWTDYDGIALRLQSGAEMRSKVGDALRPSNHWIDGRKTRRKMAGTACFYIHSLDNMDKVLDAMCRHGYSPRLGGRIVVIGSNDGTDSDGESMPEAHARALRNAILLVVVD